MVVVVVVVILVVAVVTVVVVVVEVGVAVDRCGSGERCTGGAGGSSIGRGQLVVQGAAWTHTQYGYPTAAVSSLGEGRVLRGQLCILGPVCEVEADRSLAVKGSRIFRKPSTVQ